MAESGPPISRLAIAAAICAFIGIFTGIMMIPAVILAHLALIEIRNNRWLRGNRLARFTLIVGYLGIAVVAVCVAMALSR